LVIDPAKHLIINLKRFSQTGFSYIKNSKKISFPMVLNLDQYMIHKLEKHKDADLINMYLNASMKEPW
jgi:hypothetical protein